MNRIASLLLDWYDKNARILPWRSDPHPYKVWISEIMLQQTQVDIVMPYFLRWMVRFPSLEVLADSSEQEVLACWEGLGYYSRARNILKAARIISHELGGLIPSEVASLQKLPGIGRYTAGAITSIAYGVDVPVLDGNIRRVYARLFNLEAPLGTKQAENALWELAQAELPTGQAGDYNQALMDLGAMICTPQNPVCLVCPLASACQAKAHLLQNDRPVRITKPKVPHYIVTAGVILKQGQVLIAKRPADGLLGGLWEFPGGKLQKEDTDLAACLSREIMEELGVQIEVGEAFGVYKHAYTHFKITLHAFLCQMECTRASQVNQPEAVLWVKPAQLTDFPMGKVDRQIASRLMEADHERYFQGL